MHTMEDALKIARDVKLPLTVIAATGRGEPWAIEEYGAACCLAAEKAWREAGEPAEHLRGNAGE